MTWTCPPDGRLIGPAEVLGPMAEAGVRRVGDVLLRSDAIRDLPDRSNHELTVRGTRYFVKRTKPHGLFRRVPDPPPEARGLALLAVAGVPAARVAFVGRDPRHGALTGTFDLAPARPLDVWLQRGALPHSAVDALLAALARAVAVLHGAGLCHRDLYANHVFADPHTLRVALIDAERVTKSGGLLSRLVVKDLAALDVSLPKDVVSEHARARLLVRYLVARGLPARALAAPLAKRISRKAARIAAHVPRTPVGAAARPRPGVTA
jgi:hypothetical protein